MYHRTVSYGDLEAVMQLMETEEEKARICQVINELAKRTMRGSLTPRWWLPLDTISYMGTHEAPEANVDMLNVNALAYGAPHRGE